MTKLSSMPPDYASWLADLKSRIASAQFRATLAVNSELIRLYWEIGRDILERQASHPPTSSTCVASPRSARSGRSVSSLLTNCRGSMSLCCSLGSPTLKSGNGTPPKRLSKGWSRNVLSLQIEARTLQRQGKAVTNFPARLPSVQSDFAQQALKDPYIFDFLSLSREASERDIEQGLTQHITRFLLELGAGFAFVGRQVHIEVAEDEFYIDLLFYHIKLRCYIVIELKAMEFKPEHAGQLSFYLTVVDRQLKTEHDNPTIGLLLCRKQNRLVAEYALSAIHQPIGVAEYQLTQAIPPEFAGSLPTIEQLEAELQGDLQESEAEPESHEP